jgi:TolA-binding protein
MAFLRQWLLILFALSLGGEQIMAASGRENRAYTAAAAAFLDGMYGRAETAFAQFVEKYPKSEHVGEAILLQAQAEIKLGGFTNAVARLTQPDNLAKAGPLADEYVYWTGEAQFQSGNYPAAAATWIALAQKFPESRRRLEALVDAAAAFKELAEWQQMVALLGTTNGVFQRAAQADPDGELVAGGKLFLAQARFALKDFTGAAAILEPLLDSPALKPELRRQCGLLLYQVKVAANEADAALAVTTNLLQIAQLKTNDVWRAEGMALRAGALEQLGRTNDAIAAYQENVTGAPPDQQREAVLKIARLAAAQNDFASATTNLEKYLSQFTNSPAMDATLLTLGELRLKHFAGQPAATNELARAQTNFDQFIGTFTNSPLLSKAYLDRGWCGWLTAKSAENAGDAITAAQSYTNSYEDFKTAAQKIAALNQPPSEDLLVAWFKMGDVQFVQTNFAGALENYRAVLDSLKLFPEASATLGDVALYQGVRASVKLNDMADATNLLAQLLEKFPASTLAPGGALLVAESQTDLTQPANARTLLENFEMTFTNSPLRPEAELAIARTYEQERNWPAAITNYAGWLKNFPTNDLRAQAGYSLAQADFQAGNETNASGHFTNFVAQFPMNALAPLAQWWVADHFFRAGDFENAERNYKSIFQNTNWLGSPLANQTNLFYPAQMMAGRAAVARLDYTGANRDYFEKLEADTNCPLDLRVQATFARGDALMRSGSDSTDTNNPLANFGRATNEFFQVAQLYPTNELGLLALFYIGECNVQLTNYDTATNAYALVLNSPFASPYARNQAQIGLGIALEKKAALLSGAGQNALLNEALDNYLAVFNGLNLRDDEQPDPFWLQKAGLQAAPLVGMLNNPDAEKKFYVSLKKCLPQLADFIDKKIAALPPVQN